jgi:hypothetical protein
MVETCRIENDNERTHGSDAIGVEPYFIIGYLLQCIRARLISSNMVSHGKHFIVMSHYYHVTVKWGGREAPLPPIKGGRTIGRNRLLTRKIWKDSVH